jgi:hypothetical protein
MEWKSENVYEGVLKRSRSGRDEFGRRTILSELEDCLKTRKWTIEGGLKASGSQQAGGKSRRELGRRRRSHSRARIVTRGLGRQSARQMVRKETLCISLE